MNSKVCISIPNVIQRIKYHGLNFSENNNHCENCSPMVVAKLYPSPKKTFIDQKIGQYLSLNSEQIKAAVRKTIPWIEAQKVIENSETQHKVLIDLN